MDWKSAGVDVVLECTGAFLSTAVLEPYLSSCGVKRVVVSAPVKEKTVLNVVVGVNEHKLDESHVICTAASCTTNCIAPIIKVMRHDLPMISHCTKCMYRADHQGDPREARHRDGHDHHRAQHHGHPVPRRHAEREEEGV